MQLAGKVVVVTGGARGIGLGIAQAVTDRGARVALLDRDSAAVVAAADACSRAGHVARGYAVDVTQENSVVTAMQAVAHDFGRFDALVNNAGIVKDALLVKATHGKVTQMLSLAEWQAVIDVNLTGSFLCGREAAARMIEAGEGGVIVNISSVSRHGNAGQTNYSASKAGVVAMTQVWSKELARYGIRTGAVAPGYTRTDILSGMRPEVLDKVTAPVPLKRLGEVHEIAAAALFILENDYFTGRCVDVDGGLTL
jgi:3-oxoacyl-[acyl-carrier protein] reductase